MILLKKEAELLKSEVYITGQDAEDLLEYRDVFVKFLKKSRFSYQIELSKGTYRGKEENLYRSMATIDELIKGIDSVEGAFRKHQKELEEKKQSKSK